MSLSRVLTESDRNVRSQVVLASLDNSTDKVASEKVWSGNGFFGELRENFTIHKKDFPEKALIYINQAYMSVKDGAPVVYCDYVVLGQLVVLKNLPEDFDLSNRRYTKMYSPSYDRQSRKFFGR